MKKGTAKTPGRVKLAADKLCMGRPRKLAPPDAVNAIREACATGASKIGVAMALGTSKDVLARWLSEDAALQEAFDQGREKERAILHNVVFQRAIAADGRDALLAAFFLLNCRHGYKEAASEQQGNAVSVTFTLPGAMKPEQFVIENSHDTASTATHGLSAKGFIRS